MRVAIVGASIAGLAAGALLARRGRRVTVFEARAWPGGLSEDMALAGTNRLPGDHLIWGWRSSRALARLFGSLRDRPGATTRELFQPVPTGFQVIGHPYRLDWGEHLLKEIGREFPEALPAWTACTEAWEQEAEALKQAGPGLPFPAPPMTFSEELEEAESEAGEPPPQSGDNRRALAGKALLSGDAAAGLPKEVLACLDGVARAVCWRPLEELTLPAGLLAMKMLGQEVAVLKEGVDGLVRWLVGRLKAAGGELRLEATVRSVRQRGRRVRAVVVREQKSRSTVPADAVVVAGDEVERLLARGWSRPRKRPTAGYLLTCLIAVEEEAVPEPLAPLVVYRPAPDEPTILISQNPLRFHTLGGRSRRLITIGWRAEGREAEGRMLPSELPKKLERLMPFLPGRWEMVPQEETTGSPFRRWPIPQPRPEDLELATSVAGLVAAASHPLPGMATTASLTLGVAAAEAVLGMRS